MLNKQANKLYFIPVIISYLLVSYLCLATHPVPNGVKMWFLDFCGADKLVHLLMFSSLAISTLFLLLKKSVLQNIRVVLVYAVAVPIIFGGIVEIVQHFFIIGRSGDILDLLFDIAGVFLGWWIFTLLSSHLSSQSLDQ